MYKSLYIFLHSFRSLSRLKYKYLIGDLWFYHRHICTHGGLMGQWVDRMTNRVGVCQNVCVWVRCVLNFHLKMYWIFKFRCYCYKAADVGTLCERMCVCVWGFLFCGFIFHCSQGVSGIDVRYYKMGIIFNFFYFVSRVFLFLLVAYVFCKQYCIFCVKHVSFPKFQLLNSH